MSHSEFITGAGTKKYVWRSRHAPATVAGLGLGALLLTAGISGFPRTADAKPEFAAKTGLPCGKCHASPTGGKLNSFGQAFKANGYNVPKK